MPQKLTERDLNRALLARQGLLERRAPAIPEALDAMGALQAQYAPSMYVGLWSRVEGLERDAVTRALHERTVVQATLMRSTIHLCSRADFWPLALAVRAARRAAWLRSRGDLTAERMEAAAATLREALAEGPLKRRRLDELVGRDVAPGVGLWADLVRVPPSGTWERRRADLYGLAEDWLGPPDATDPVVRLVTRYLTGFGPAARADIASWTGLAAADLEPALAGLVRHEAEDGTELLDLPGLPLPPADTPAPVRFLPTWDAALLVHARRTGILPEPYRDRVFNTRMPQSIGTFLVDGRVAGTWRPDGTLEHFTALSRAERAQVDAEARRLLVFIS